MITFEVEVCPAEECAAAEARRGAVVEVKMFRDGPAHRAHVGPLWLCRRRGRRRSGARRRRSRRRRKREGLFRCPRDGTHHALFVHNSTPRFQLRTGIIDTEARYNVAFPVAKEGCLA